MELEVRGLGPFLALPLSRGESRFHSGFIGVSGLRIFSKW